MLGGIKMTDTSEQMQIHDIRKEKNTDEWPSEDYSMWFYTAMVDKTDELAKMVECFCREQEVYDRQDRFYDEFADVDVHGLPEADIAKGWQMIFDDPEKLETFFTLDGAQRNLYVEKLVRGG